MVTMNRLDNARRTEVVKCLIEGMSIRSTVRITGVAKNTIVKLLVSVGRACAEYHDRTVRNVKSQRIQCDEIWSFVGAKAKNVKPEKRDEGWGDIWTWVAIDADTKLVPHWLHGNRTGCDAPACLPPPP